MPTLIKELPWSEAIEQVIADHGGTVSLERMYADILKYRDVSRNTRWKETLRGILYRDMETKKRIKRVGLGVFGFAHQSRAQTTFEQIVHEEKVKPIDNHSHVQGMLLELGNFYKFKTYTADPTKEFDGKQLGSIATLQELPAFTGFQDVLEKAKRIDVLWLTGRAARAFPKLAFEVENSTDFTRSMLKMYQLRDFDAIFYLIAPTDREHIFQARVNDDPFFAMRQKYVFRSFAQVTRLYQVAVEHFVLQSHFLGESL